jgi:glycosyltransferase involved in cell wall biosynthesis
MKVLQIITKGEAGGAQTHLLEICRALHERVELVVVIGGSDAAPLLEEQLRALGVGTRRLAPMVNSLSPWRLLRSTRALTRLLQQEKPDVIHAHSAIAGATARMAGRLANIPVVYTVHGFGFKPQAPWPQRFAALLLEWLLARLTAHMICVSEHERALARRLPLPAGRISVVHNALQDNTLRAQPALEPMRVVMVARCAPPKRHDLLLQALALAAARLGREIPATLVGGGPQLPALQAQARALGLAQVRFTGDVGDVAQRLAEHNAFALVSDHEGLPISVIEALRCGLPVVGSDLPGLRELIDHGQEGWLVPNLAAPLADALLALAAQPQERARMGQAARGRYEQQFEAQRMGQSVLAVYGQIQPHESHIHH